MTTEQLNGGSEPSAMERAKKNLVYAGIISIIMFFGGLTSAYIVSKGSSFWVKAPMPLAFWISTGVLLLSSFCIFLAVRAAQKQKLKAVQGLTFATFILGVIFILMQFKGYGELIDKGIFAANNHILVTNGRYGDYFEVKMDSHFIEVEGNRFLKEGRDLNPNEMKAYKAFMSQFLELKSGEAFRVKHSARFVLYHENKPMSVVDGKLFKSDSTSMSLVEQMRLKDLAVHVRDERGDFFVKGNLGEDFDIYYKGKKLEYVNRELRLNGTKLSPYLQLKAMESADTASSYLYIITFAHLLHVFITLFFMLRLTYLSFSGKILQNNAISLRVGAIFWHFLDFLWIFLLLFLLFIH